MLWVPGTLLRSEDTKLNNSWYLHSNSLQSRDCEATCQQAGDIQGI